MCLNLKSGDSKQKTAQEDIVCWKWLMKYSNGKLFSPYQRMEYFLDRKMHDDKKVDRKEKRKNGVNNKYLPVVCSHKMSQGGYHTFKNFEDADKFVKDDRTSNSVLVKCIIPKGSKYYEGYFQAWGYDYVIESYASKDLIVTGEVLYYNVVETHNDHGFGI